MEDPGAGQAGMNRFLLPVGPTIVPVKTTFIGLLLWKTAIPSDDSQSLCVLSSNECWPVVVVVDRGRQERLQFNYFHQNVSLIGQQLIRRIMLSEAVRWGAVKLPAVPGCTVNILQSSKCEVSSRESLAAPNSNAEVVLRHYSNYCYYYRAIIELQLSYGDATS